MKAEVSPEIRIFENNYYFSSFDVPVRLESNDPAVLAEMVETVRSAMAGEFQKSGPATPELAFGVWIQDGDYHLIENGKPISQGSSKRNFFQYFKSIIRIRIAESAKSHVIVHAGVVGWKGRALVFPASSFRGKTTLVAELVKRGAEYYSDDYAVLDERGLVHPFPRDLSLRSDNESYDQTDVPPEDIGAKIGTDAIPVGVVLITEFDRGLAEWEPRRLTPGEGVLEMVSQTIPIRANTQFALSVLNRVATGSIIVKGARNDVKHFAPVFLEFVDKQII